MSWTKREIVEFAFEEIGLAAYVYDLTPDQLASAMKRLDMMLATWNADGIRIGYPLPSSPNNSDLDDSSGTTDMATEAMVLNLAVRLAPGFGKTVSPDTKMGAKNSYDALIALSAMPNEMQFPSTLPSGAGNKPWRRTGRNEYFPEPAEPLEAGNDSTITFE